MRSSAYVRSFWYIIIVACLALLTGLRPAAAAQTPQPPATMLQQPSLAAALAAERNGDYATAEANYRTLAASLQPAMANAGQLALGRFLERHGRPADAVALLQSLVPALSDTPDGLRATFLLGEAQADTHQYQAAAESFKVYLAGGGAASGYAALEVAWALQGAHDDAGALDALAVPLQAGSVAVQRAALKAASISHERLQDPAQAAADQVAFVDTRPPAADRAAALVEAGRLFHLAGDDTNAAGVLLRVIQDYPGYAAAGSALDRLDALSIDVDPLQRGVVLFNLGRLDAARTVLQPLADGGPSGDEAARVSYYLARISDRRDENDAALSGYADAYTLSPNGPLAAAALWARAELLNYLGRNAEAQDAYAALAQQFPRSSNAADATFNGGLMAYLDGRAADAATIWGAIAASAQGEDAARAELWLGKLAQTASDPGATGHFARAQAAQPSGYFGLRAEVLTGAATVGLTGGAVTPPPADWASVEAWLSSWAGAENPAAFVTVQATQDWTEALELDALGWMITPNTLFESALSGIVQQPWALYRAARALADRGRTMLALEAADDLLRLAGVRAGGTLNAPVTLLRLAYPLDYADLLTRNGAQSGLDPLLLAAVTRQESAFEPTAGSSAGAQGLMQLVPGTAADEARALGLTSYTATDLTRPLINLQLGTGYLALQARAANNDLSRTLAAYNGGGGNAARWVRSAGSDPDRFYEAVDFSETRRYIRLVSENYAVYRYLYRGGARPSLLHP